MSVWTSGVRAGLVLAACWFRAADSVCWAAASALTSAGWATALIVSTESLATGVATAFTSVAGLGVSKGTVDGVADLEGVVDREGRGGEGRVESDCLVDDSPLLVPSFLIGCAVFLSVVYSSSSAVRKLAELGCRRHLRV